MGFQQDKNDFRIRLRCILIGLVLLPINIYLMSVAELKYDSQATALPLFIYTVCLLFFLNIQK